jgi:hypothetical protein
MAARELALRLARCDQEDDVIEELRAAGYWEDGSAWQYYGGRENNFSVIGDQQSEPESALVEKITNSVDAVLMRECFAAGIHPESREAPRSTEGALEMFFSIPKGKLSRITPAERTALAENICLVATGSRRKPCYSVVDRGEGQTPRMLPSTILSLGESNKLRIPFVQGRFNMGGTGVLQFCGDHNLQLVISRRHRSAPAPHDPTSQMWGMTIVRREYPTGDMRNSTYRYLAPRGEVLSFAADSLPLWPDSSVNAQTKPLEAGTFIKLYEYDMTGYRTAITLDLYYRLSLLMPRIAVPVRLYEMRGYSAHTLETTLTGLGVRLDEDTRDNLETGFPTHHQFSVLGQQLSAQVYTFRAGASENYKRSEGILFVLNGQTHGSMDDRFFARKTVNLDYIRDSMLVIVDCSGLDAHIRENTFMNSRDRLRQTEFRSEVEKALERELGDHRGLKRLANQRRLEATRNKISDAKPLAEALQAVLRKSPTFASLFIDGHRLPSPFDLRSSEEEEQFEGRQFPTFFKLEKELGQNDPKHCPVNRGFRVEYITDAANDYLGRDLDPGEFQLRLNGEPYPHSINLWNGRGYLNLRLPGEAKPGDVLTFTSTVSDVQRVDPFVETFFVRVEPMQVQAGGGGGGRRKPSARTSGDDASTQAHLALPEMIPVYRDQWARHRFDDQSALRVVRNGNGGWDFFINMDNKYLLAELKADETVTELLKARFQFGLTLLGLSLLRRDGDPDEEMPIEDDVRAVSQRVAPIVLPMIAALGQLEA